jgi:hypothetical protein
VSSRVDSEEVRMAKRGSRVELAEVELMVELQLRMRCKDRESAK